MTRRLFDDRDVPGKKADHGIIHPMREVVSSPRKRPHATTTPSCAAANQCQTVNRQGTLVLDGFAAAAQGDLNMGDFRLVYFVHSTSSDNEVGAASGWLDPGLSARGLTQARNLRDAAAAVRPDAVYASDLRRAIETAEAAFGAWGPITRDARLRECNYGALNGSPLAAMQAIQLECVTTPYPDGESYSDVLARVKSFLVELGARHPGGTVVIVAHRAPQLALDVLLRGKTWEQAFAEDWRLTAAWQPGWHYTMNQRTWAP